MKFLLDENLPISTALLLKQIGFEVEHVKTGKLHGAEDSEIVIYAKKQKAILVTKDIECGNILIYPIGSHYGLLMLRLPYDFTAEQINKALKNFLSKIDSKELINALTILEVGKYRIRKYPLISKPY